MKQKAIFLDRDGVINKEINYLHKIEDFIFQKGIFVACQHFIKLNYVLIVITNQSGIARGYYNEHTYSILNDWMLVEFKKKNIDILHVFHCPHSPKNQCNCRKPQPGLFNQARKLYNIDMLNSWMIGDKETDIEAAKKAGIEKTILVRDLHYIDESKTKANYILNSIDESITLIQN